MIWKKEIGVQTVEIASRATTTGYNDINIRLCGTNITRWWAQDWAQKKEENKNKAKRPKKKRNKTNPTETIDYVTSSTFTILSS